MVEEKKDKKSHLRGESVTERTGWHTERKSHRSRDLATERVDVEKNCKDERLPVSLNTISKR